MSKPTDNTSKPSADQLTTSAGNPLADNQNSLSAGPTYDGWLGGTASSDDS